MLISRVDIKARQHTEGAAVRSAADEVVLKLEILVEDGAVELDLAIVLIADTFPVRSGF